MKTPLHVVLTWPDWLLQLYHRFLSVEPSAEQRMDWTLTEMLVAFLNVNRRENVPAFDRDSVSPYTSAWKRRDMAQRYSEEDLELFSAFGVKPP